MRSKQSRQKKCELQPKTFRFSIRFSRENEIGQPVHTGTGDGVLLHILPRKGFLAVRTHHSEPALYR
jgi:hypothetical protein